MSDTTRPTASPAHAVEDLAFLRDLAESGRDAPFGGGDYLIAGGGWFALASLIIWAGAQGALRSRLAIRAPRMGHRGGGLRGPPRAAHPS
jgi:hypothetical protein